ncbi:hypothetical protein BD769DRAFT_101582 [Suillus cothurnatus]|nr:hypothetical protein BD769DRAFT_101582 [Suillus cothurnatus]
MSPSTRERSITPGNYSFAHNLPVPQSNQHNGGVDFDSSPLAMGSNAHAFQISSTSSQHIATASDMHAVVPMMANFNEGARSRTPSNPTMGTFYSSPHASPMPGSIGYTSPVTAWDTLPVVHTMANPSAASWTQDNLGTAVSYCPFQSMPYLQDLGGTRFGPPSHPAIGRAHSSPRASQTPTPIGHTLPASLQREVTTFDTHPVVPMIANLNPNAVSWTPGNFRTAVSHGTSQSVPYDVHDLGGMNTSIQLPPAQPELPINQPSPLLCRIGMIAIFLHAKAR